MLRFLDLPVPERLEALEYAAARSGRPIYLLEKDIWVVWALEQLFNSPHADHLTFKGGTSLSKAFRVISRFSEDIDITYDIREIAHDLTGDSAEPLPQTRSQGRRWTEVVRLRLPAFIAGEMVPLMSRALQDIEQRGTVTADADHLFISYPGLAGDGSGYVKPEVRVDFGARSTGEPHIKMPILSDAAEWLRDLEFPSAAVNTMKAERTFWEKATAIHVYCLGAKVRGGGDRFSRHWYDLARLAEAGIAEMAIADRDLASRVAAHKARFFRESDRNQEEIDYSAAVSGHLQLVPSGDELPKLRADFARMVDAGMLLGDAAQFEDLMKKCRELEVLANSKGSGG